MTGDRLKCEGAKWVDAWRLFAVYLMRWVLCLKRNWPGQRNAWDGWSGCYERIIGGGWKRRTERSYAEKQEGRWVGLDRRRRRRPFEFDVSVWPAWSTVPPPRGVWSSWPERGFVLSVQASRKSGTASDAGVHSSDAPLGPLVPVTSFQATGPRRSEETSSPADTFSSGTTVLTYMGRMDSGHASLPSPGIQRQVDGGRTLKARQTSTIEGTRRTSQDRSTTP